MHPLTAIRGEWISEIKYRDIEIIIQHDSQKCITSDVRDDLSNNKLANCEIEYDHLCCSYFTKALYLDIEKENECSQEII